MKEVRSSVRLPPRLNLLDSTAIGLGTTIGGGIFIITGMVAGLAGLVAVSTFATLFNYSLANISAFKLKAMNVYPKAIPATGLALCAFLMLFIHRDALMTGMVILVFYYLRKKMIDRIAGKNKHDAGGTR